MLNALTVDVEDYFQVSAFESVVAFEDWGSYESRVARNTERVLRLLEDHRARATFFVLGWVAERHPGLVRMIQEQGHEVASHGYSHRCVYAQVPDEFREETRRAKGILEDAIGRPVIGYRAASYSITAKSLWALDILREEGFRYDSSIFPVHHDRYGIPGWPRFCQAATGGEEGGLIEVPLSTVRLGGINIPFGGGGYLRLLPYGFTRWGIRRLNGRERQPAVVYVHPWELDPDQPRIPAPILSRFRHYVNLRKTARRVARLLEEFRFGPVREVLRELGLMREPDRVRNRGDSTLQ